MKGEGGGKADEGEKWMAEKDHQTQFHARFILLSQVVEPIVGPQPTTDS